MLSTGIRLALATHNSDGTIHLVPMNYVVIEHRIRLLAKAKSQKVINAHREPRASVMIERGVSYDALAGIVMYGRLTVLEAPDVLRQTAVALNQHLHPEADLSPGQIADATLKRVVLEFAPERVLSWDHTKLRTRL